MDQFFRHLIPVPDFKLFQGILFRGVIYYTFKSISHVKNTSMKKLLILSNLLFLLIILYQGCKSTGGNDTSKKCPACKDYTNSPTSGRISWHFAQTIAENYKTDRSKSQVWVNQKPTDSSDARTIWFSLETLKQFIWSIEKSNCSNACNDSLGIRIYYARYPAFTDPLWGTVGLTPVKRYANHHTVFMVPTYWDKQYNTHFDFEPGGGKCRKGFDTTSGKRTLLLFGGIAEDAGDAQNHGNLIPPDDDKGLAF